jgi:hypothetical protein
VEDRGADALGLNRPMTLSITPLSWGITDGSDRWRDAFEGQVLGEPERGVLGGFNLSSQHLDRGGVHGQTSWVDAGVDGQSADEVAGHAVAAA